MTVMQDVFCEWANDNEYPVQGLLSYNDLAQEHRLIVDLGGTPTRPVDDNPSVLQHVYTPTGLAQYRLFGNRHSGCESISIWHGPRLDNWQNNRVTYQERVAKACLVFVPLVHYTDVPIIADISVRIKILTAFVSSRDPVHSLLDTFRESDISINRAYAGLPGAQEMQRGIVMPADALSYRAVLDRVSCFIGATR